MSKEKSSIVHAVLEGLNESQSKADDEVEMFVSQIYIFN